jgi:hypothetical protein
MDKYQREANPRELTEEEIKTVAGGTSSNSQPNPKWSNQGGFELNGAGNQWREGTTPPVGGVPNEKPPK